MTGIDIQTRDLAVMRSGATFAAYAHQQWGDDAPVSETNHEVRCGLVWNSCWRWLPVARTAELDDFLREERQDLQRTDDINDLIAIEEERRMADPDDIEDTEAIPETTPGGNDMAKILKRAEAAAYTGYSVNNARHVVPPVPRAAEVWEADQGAGVGGHPERSPPRLHAGRTGRVARVDGGVSRMSIDHLRRFYLIWMPAFIAGVAFIVASAFISLTANGLTVLGMLTALTGLGEAAWTTTGA